MVGTHNVSAAKLVNSVAARIAMTPAVPDSDGPAPGGRIKQVQDRADGRGDQHHVDRDLAPVGCVEMDPQLIPHRDRERDQQQQQERVSRSGMLGVSEAIPTAR
jgi:hypothetical protein